MTRPQLPPRERQSDQRGALLPSFIAGPMERQDARALVPNVDVARQPERDGLPDGQNIRFLANADEQGRHDDNRFADIYWQGRATSL